MKKSGIGVFSWLTDETQLPQLWSPAEFHVEWRYSACLQDGLEVQLRPPPQVANLRTPHSSDIGARTRAWPWHVLKHRHEVLWLEGHVLALGLVTLVLVNINTGTHSEFNYDPPDIECISDCKQAVHVSITRQYANTPIRHQSSCGLNYSFFSVFTVITLVPKY